MKTKNMPPSECEKAKKHFKKVRRIQYVSSLCFTQHKMAEYKAQVSETFHS